MSDCILLNASGAAYNIAPGASVYTPDPLYHPKVSYIGNPVPIVAGLDFENAATVGQSASGIIVAFRGTIPLAANDVDSWLSWLQDFGEAPTTSPGGPTAVPGSVHSGFFDATTSIIQAVRDQVMALSPGDGNPVYVTGHSKGGAMASLGAYILKQNFEVPGIQPVVTFASPKTGDAVFQAAFQSVIQQTRYENFNDLVPLLPPTDDLIDPVVTVLQHIPLIGGKLASYFQQAKNWNYVPLGQQKFITSTFAVIENSSVDDQVDDVLKEIVQDLWNRDFSSFGVAHSLAPGDGYHAGACPAAP